MGGDCGSHDAEPAKFEHEARNCLKEVIWKVCAGI
jgi:hypothetical protein